MRWPLLLLVPLALACGDSSTEPTASVAGTWQLQTVNGAALPFTILQIGTSKTEVTSGSINALSTGSYTTLTALRTTTNGQVSTQNVPGGGTFTLNGTAVVFHNSDGSTGTGTVSGNTFTLALNGFSYVYTRQ